MPIYEYECWNCNHEFDELVAWQYKETVMCPECGCKPTPKISRFIINDYPVKAVRLNGEEIR